MPNEGEPAPDFTLPGVTGAGEEVQVTLSALQGRPVVLSFSPKDDTPGCTKQACGIRDAWPDLGRTEAAVFGISPDDPESHRKFSRKYDLPFTLLADEGHEVAERYGVWKEKSLYGRKHWGVERTTFIIGADGRIAKVFPRVKPGRHAGQVLEALEI